MYELDGLKPFPVDHGPLNSDHVVGTQNAKSSPNWTNKFKNIIRQRLSSFNSGYVIFKAYYWEMFKCDVIVYVIDL